MKKLRSLVVALRMLCTAVSAAAMICVGGSSYCAVRVRPATIGTLGGLKVMP